MIEALDVVVFWIGVLTVLLAHEIYLRWFRDHRRQAAIRWYRLTLQSVQGDDVFVRFVKAYTAQEAIAQATVAVCTNIHAAPVCFLARIEPHDGLEPLAEDCL